jgi:arsenate reductase
MAPKTKILFLCTGNACRSQMAEGWTRHLLGNQLEPYSAGIAPHGVDPRAATAMAEAGVDVSRHRSKHLDELAGIAFDVVVTVCDNANEQCPIFPGKARTLHRGFDDPPRLAADLDPDGAMAPYRRVRDEIRWFVEGLPALLDEPG